MSRLSSGVLSAQFEVVPIAFVFVITLLYPSLASKLGGVISRTVDSIISHEGKYGAWSEYTGIISKLSFLVKKLELE